MMAPSDKALPHWHPLLDPLKRALCDISETGEYGFAASRMREDSSEPSSGLGRPLGGLDFMAWSAAA
jgi:hypothetical protein